MTSSDLAALPIVDIDSQVRFEVDKFVLDHLFGPETNNSNEAEIVISEVEEDEEDEGIEEDEEDDEEEARLSGDEYEESEEGIACAHRDILQRAMAQHGVITNPGQGIWGSQMVELFAIVKRLIKYEEDIMDRAMEMLKEGIVIPWNLEIEELPYTYKDLFFLHQKCLSEHEGDDDDLRDIRDLLWMPIRDFDESKEELLAKDDKFKDLWQDHIKMLAESESTTDNEKKRLRELEVPSLAIPAELDDDDGLLSDEDEEEKEPQAAQTPPASQSLSQVSWNYWNDWDSRLGNQTSDESTLEFQETDDDATPPLSPPLFTSTQDDLLAQDRGQEPASDAPIDVSQLSLEGVLYDMVDKSCP